MCQDCGCGLTERVALRGKQARPVQYHLDVHQDILAKNDKIAQQNRRLFQTKRLTVLNFLSSPGSGKTALIERMLTDCGSQWRIGAIIGDLATENDAQRLQKLGASAVQVTTGNICHLDAEMVNQALLKLHLDDLDLLIIENVGNLVCPAAYDLGEERRVVLLSVTEGEDKPLKYPTAFKTAQVAILNKIDIAEAVGCERELAVSHLQTMSPQATLFEVSARTGEGIAAWYRYVEELMAQKRFRSTSAPE
ncbi:MAG: hydrogenase nickel incorporation protein HypB [Cyanophyceae cyanobacterium]